MKRHRVALLIETSQIYGRELYEGIADYFEGGVKWSTFLDQRQLSSTIPRWFTSQKWDGVISRVTTPALARVIKRMAIPAVDLTDRIAPLGIPRIASDQEAIGELVAEHFLSRQFRNFAFCGFRGEYWSEGRLNGFRQRIQREQYTLDVYNSHWHEPDAMPWNLEQRELSRWIQKLPKPIGIMACNDQRGHQVLEACRLLESAVPKEVSVIGVDDDRVLCRLSDPPLSSVVPNARKIGFQAAKLLSQLMNRKGQDQKEILIPPIRISSRRSSDAFAIEEPTLAAVMELIQQQSCEGLGVSDILKQFPVSRSWLERQFRETVGATPHSLIRRTQLNRAMQLLSDSTLSLKEVSKECGFTNIEYFYYLFRKVTGETPGQYRERNSSLS